MVYIVGLYWIGTSDHFFWNQWLQLAWGLWFSVSDYSHHEAHGFQSNDYSFCGAYGFQWVITDSMGPLVFSEWLHPPWGIWFSVSDYRFHGASGFLSVNTASMGPLVFCQWLQPPWSLWFNGEKIITFWCYICY